MTYRDLFEAVRAILPADSFSIQVETWQHMHFDGPQVNTEWTIWVAKHSLHVGGNSPDAALAALKSALEPCREAPADPCVTA